MASFDPMIMKRPRRSFVGETGMLSAREVGLELSSASGTRSARGLVSL